jgi:pimeloyl-ACP methyl ester carboxylesterase
LNALVPGLIRLREYTLELIDTGSGRPIVFLHGGDGIDPRWPVLQHLASLGRLIAPSHPGFGHSALPAHFRSVDDLAYAYLDLFEQMNLQDVVLVGTSLGGWIAAEMAVRSTARIGHLVLADAVGIRCATDETAADIADVFSLSPADIETRAYADPARWRRSYDDCSDDELLVMARNREALSLYGWSPYLHNPILRHWLHRIDRPTLVLWGAADRITAPEYGRAWAAGIAGAQFTQIDEAAHHPHIEQADRFAREIAGFAGLADTTTA